MQSARTMAGGCPRPPRSARRGFTLAELVVAAGVVSVLAGLAVYSVTRARERVEVERSMASLRAGVERARALARVAGPRLGTGRVRYDAACSNPGGNMLWVDLDPGTGTVVLPSRIQYEPLTDELTVFCQLWDWGGPRGAEDEASFLFPEDPIVFGFSPNGRLVFAPGTARQDVFVQLALEANQQSRPGFRVLSSGLTCLASEPDPSVEPCDEEAGP